MEQEPGVSSEVGTKLLFENDRVRVWDLRLEPGEGSGLHQHDHDYLYVVIGDGKLKGVQADGTALVSHEQCRTDRSCFTKLQEEAVHEAVNAGETPWRNIVVEFKE